MKNAYINNIAKSSFKDWTREGLEFLSKDNQQESNGKFNFHKILQEAIRELEDEE